MSSITLVRVGDGGAKIVTINEGKTVIGRGPLLQVTDKRVSRNHGILEVSDGKLYLTPTHTNPCFFKKTANSSVEIMKKDDRRLLENGQIFGLLPDSLYFKVQCPVTQNGTEQSQSVEEEKSEEEAEEEEETQAKTRPWERIVKPDGKKDMTLPLEKKRVLPAWMVQMAKSPPPGGKAAPARQTAKIPTKRKIDDDYSPVKKKAANRRRKTESEEDEDFDIEEEEEEEEEKFTTKRGRGTTKKKYSDASDDDDDDDDWELEEEEEYKPKKRASAKSRPAPKAKPKPRRKARESSEEEELDEDVPKKKRGGKSRGRRGSSEDEKPSTSSRSLRAARTKRKSYVDDFVDFSDEDDFLPAGSRSKDEDSDFVLDESESASDWEMEAKSSQKKKGTPSRRSSRTVGRKRYADSDEESESEDEYVPPSKRQQIPAKRSARGRRIRKETSDEGSESSSDDYVAPKRDPKTKKRKEESESEEEEEEEETPKKKTTKKNVDEDSDSEERRGGKKKDRRDDVKKVRQLKSKHRPPCMFGKKCYRKNPEHFAEFSHPGDVSYDEQSDLEETEEKQDCPYGDRCYRTNVSHLKQYRHYTREKGTRLEHLSEKKPADDKGRNGEEESQGPNTYDYNDSFINDESQKQDDEGSGDEEEGEGGSEEEDDIKQLKAEAKDFMKNEKMVKPV